jgi:serine/threonine-protein kinase PknG
MAILVCTSCHSPLTPGEDVCENCGAINTQAPDPQANGSPASPATCPSCHHPLSSGEDICENCGAIVSTIAPLPVTLPGTAVAPVDMQAIAPIATPQAVAATCPNCGALGIPGKKFCGRCGTRLPQTQTQAGGPPSSNSPIHILAGKYRLEKKLGEGGMGTVCLAEDLILKRKVVIKALVNNNDPELLALSVKEREFLAEINHPNIVAIYDFVSQGQDGYIVMEYVQGKTLDQMLEERGRPFDVKTGIQYILDILPAFAYLARLNLVYCDFKPSNVMIHQLRDGTTNAKLIDLGTVIRYGPKPDSIYGTAGYYAREAVKNPSPQTDLYTICRTLAYIVTMMDMSDPLFGMPSDEKYQVFRDNPALYRLLVKGTHNDPRRRFENVGELDEQLRGVLRLSAGAEPGVPVHSHKFISTGLTKTSALGGQRGVIALDEHDNALHTLLAGDQALQIGNYVGAVAYYQQAAQANQQSIDAYIRLVDTFIERGDLPSAEEHLHKAEHIDASNWKVRWSYGRLYEASGALQNAVDIYTDLTLDLPGELPPLESLARVYARMGNDHEAIRLYQSVLYADPDNVDAIFGIAQCEIRRQFWPEAILHLSSVHEASSRYPDAQLMLCDIYLNRASPALPTIQDIQSAAEAVSKLKGRITDVHYYLVQAETYHIAWQMARNGSLPKNTPIVEVQEATTRSLGQIARESYEQYLRRDQSLVPREDIIRRKFEVAPWQLV